MRLIKKIQLKIQLIKKRQQKLYKNLLGNKLHFLQVFSLINDELETTKKQQSKTIQSITR